VERKRQNAHDAPQKTSIVILATVFASLALADDFKTINGTEHKNATVSRVEPDGIVLKSKSGITKVYFTELPKEVQERFRYDVAQAAQFNATTQNAISENNAAIAKQQAEAAKTEMEQLKRATEQRRQSEQRQVEMERRDRTTQLENQIVKLRKQIATQQAQAAKASKRQRRGSDDEIRARNAESRANQYRNDLNHYQEQQEMNSVYGR
jgi:hypothetical protein